MKKILSFLFVFLSLVSFSQTTGSYWRVTKWTTPFGQALSDSVRIMVKDSAKDYQIHHIGGVTATQTMAYAWSQGWVSRVPKDLIGYSLAGMGVTSISQGTGMLNSVNPITTTGTVGVDTSFVVTHNDTLPLGKIASKYNIKQWLEPSTVTGQIPRWDGSKYAHSTRITWNETNGYFYITPYKSYSGYQFSAGGYVAPGMTFDSTSKALTISGYYGMMPMYGAIRFTNGIGTVGMFSENNNFLVGSFTENWEGKLQVGGSIWCNSIAHESTDVDKFLVSSTGVLKYRTGSEVLLDIGGQASGTYVTSVSATSPIVSSGTTTPTISADTSKLMLFNDTLGTGSTGKIQTKYQSRNYLTVESDPKYIADSSNIAYLNQQNSFSKDQIINGINAGKGTGNGSNNTVFGNGALANSDGSNNIAIGYHALESQYRSDYNMAIGVRSLQNINGGQYNTALGYSAGGSVAYNSYNTIVGNDAMSLGDGGYSTAIGASALFKNSGTGNSAVGNSAMENNTSGSYNTAIGQFALRSNVTGQQNIALGQKAGYNETGSDKLYIESGGTDRDTTTSIIYGDMAKDWIRLNADVLIKNNLFLNTVPVGTSANRLLIQDTVTGKVKRIPYPNITYYPSLQDTLNDRYRRKDTATVLLSRTRASHDYETKISSGTTSQYWRGDKSWQTLPVIKDSTYIRSGTAIKIDSVGNTYTINVDSTKGVLFNDTLTAGKIASKYNIKQWLESGTATGQLPYWDGSKYAHSTHITWDETNDRLTLTASTGNGISLGDRYSSGNFYIGRTANSSFGSYSAWINFGYTTVSAAAANFVSFGTWIAGVGGGEAGRFAPSGNLLLKTTTDNSTDALQVNGSVYASEQNGKSTARFGALEIHSYATDYVWLTDNIYFDGVNYRLRATSAAKSSRLKIYQGALSFHTAPAGTADDAVSLTNIFEVGNTGNAKLAGTLTVNGKYIYGDNANTYLSLNNSAGSGLYYGSSSVLVGSGTINITAVGAGGYVNIGSVGTTRWTVNASGHFVPYASNSYDLGIASTNVIRAVYATNLYGAVTPTGFTEGSVVFAGSGGVLSQDNSNLFYNATTHSLTVGGNMNMSATSYTYIGGETVDGSWRFFINGSGDLEWDCRIGGNWVNKMVIKK